MEEETRKRLEAALELKRQKDKVAQKAAEAVQRAAKLKQTNVTTTSERWPAAKKQIESAIKSVNTTIHSSGYQFVLREAKKQEKPDYLQVAIDCLLEATDGQQIILNIEEEGNVRAVFVPENNRSALATIRSLS